MPVLREKKIFLSFFFINLRFNDHFVTIIMILVIDFIKLALL